MVPEIAGFDSGNPQGMAVLCPALCSPSPGTPEASLQPHSIKDTYPASKTLGNGRENFSQRIKS